MTFSGALFLCKEEFFELPMHGNIAALRSIAMSIKINILQLILNKGNFMSSLNHRLSDFIRIHSIVFCDD